MKNNTSQLKTEGATVEASHLTCRSTANTRAAKSADRPRFTIKDCGDYFRVKWLDGLGEISCYTKDAYGFATVAELRNWIIFERLA